MIRKQGIFHFQQLQIQFQSPIFETSLLLEISSICLLRPVPHFFVSSWVFCFTKQKRFLGKIEFCTIYCTIFFFTNIIFFYGQTEDPTQNKEIRKGGFTLKQPWSVLSHMRHDLENWKLLGKRLKAVLRLSNYDNLIAYYKQLYCCFRTFKSHGTNGFRCSTGLT